MGRTAQTIEFSTDLGINYILCCYAMFLCGGNQIIKNIYRKVYFLFGS